MSYRQLRFIPFIICGLAAFFYFYEFFLRVMPSAFTDELLHSFKTDAVGLGFLSALFYYGYSPMQIPAGLALDRFGPRRTLTTAVLLCGLATLAFGFTTSFAIAGVSRLAIGIAASCAYLGVLVLARNWFHARHFAMIAGFAQLLGSFGAIVGEGPTALMGELYGWRTVVFWSALACIVLAILFWLIIRDGPKVGTIINRSPVSPWARLKSVCARKQTWAIGLAAFFTWAPVSAFAALWGIPFIAEKYIMPHTDAAGLMAFAWLGIALGGAPLGWWSNRIKSRRIPLYTCAALALTSSVIIIYFKPPIPLLDVCLFLFGVAASGQAVTFGLVDDIHPPEAIGTATGFNNMAVIAGGVILQPLIGWILDLFWDDSYIVKDIQRYSVHSYKLALGLIPLCAVGLILTLLFLVKETHAKVQHPHEEITA